MALKSVRDFYENGGYAAKSPDWDMSHAPWKAAQLLRALQSMPVAPKTIVEIGCGSGEVLRQLQLGLGESVSCRGLDISPQALELARQRQGPLLRFDLGGVESLTAAGTYDDVSIIADVVEHVENPFAFLRELSARCRYGAFLIPLDMNVDYLLRPRKMLGLRADVGHIHYFSRETAVALLKDSGFEPLHLEVVNMYIDTPATGVAAKLVRIVKAGLFRLMPTFVPRIFGGYTLLVLAKAV